MKVFIGLGSNLGDRVKNIQDALNIFDLNKDIKIKKVSSFYETLPYGKTDQPDFINVAAEIETELTADDLLKFCLNTEDSLGRSREDKWGPRIIDIDILFYGDSVLEKVDLKIPHPLLHKREFVLFPLNEIASDFVHPVLNKTIGELKKGFPGTEIIRIFQDNVL